MGDKTYSETNVMGKASNLTYPDTKASDQIETTLVDANFRCLGRSDSVFDVWADGHQIVLVEHAPRSGTEVFIPIVNSMLVSETIAAIAALKR